MHLKLAGSNHGEPELLKKSCNRKETS